MKRTNRGVGYFLALSGYACLFYLGTAVGADRVALIVGVDNYESETVPDLEGALRDAKIMAESLKKLNPPFDVQLLEDPSVNGVRDAFDVFMAEAKKADCALFYFAGHGIEYHGENFLMLSDSNLADNVETSVEATKRRLRRKLLSLNSVMDDIELTESELKLIILDACRNNPISVEDGSSTRSLGGTRGLASVSAPLGMLVSYSADAGQVANDGLFTEILANNLAEPNLSVMAVFAKTREEVNSLSRKRKAEDGRYFEQVPAEYNKLGMAGIQFVFNPTGKGGGSSGGTMPKPPDPKPDIPSVGDGKEPPVQNFRNAAGMEMIRIPAGRFEMGDLEGKGSSSEIPIRTVEMSAYHLSETEVTQGNWETIMGQSIHELREAAGYTGQSKWGVGADYPVYYVSWEEANEFCRRLTALGREKNMLSRSYTYHLPTEAQWEYACRAGSRKPFYKDDPYRIAEISNYQGAALVAGKSPNDYGLFDMHGNVWEWCRDYYKHGYEGLGTSDPNGPTSGETRVFRGGSWLELEYAARASNRGFALPTYRHRTVGFRVALSAE